MTWPEFLHAATAPYATVGAFVAPWLPIIVAVLSFLVAAQALRGARRGDSRVARALLDRGPRSARRCGWHFGLRFGRRR